MSAALYIEEQTSVQLKSLWLADVPSCWAKKDVGSEDLPIFPDTKDSVGYPEHLLLSRI